jgi:hypothetical protein
MSRIPWWLGPSSPGDPGTVEHDHDVLAVQPDVEVQLVEGAREERRVERDDGDEPGVREPGSRGERVLLGDADVDDAVRRPRARAAAGRSSPASPR